MIYLGTATNSYAYYIKALFISKLYTIIFFTVMQNIGILGTFWEHFGNKKYHGVYSNGEETDVMFKLYLKRL